MNFNKNKNNNIKKCKLSWTTGGKKIEYSPLESTIAYIARMTTTKVLKVTLKGSYIVNFGKISVAF